MSDRPVWQVFAYVVLPYLSLTIFVVGHIWRYRFDRFGWTSRSSELYERRWLLVGAPLFHYGAILAILGHALGLLVPKSATSAIGIPESVYSAFSKTAGSIAAVLVVVGLLVLLVRRVATARVRHATGPVDWVAAALLTIVVGIGFGVTVVYNVLGPGYDYRETVSIWMRGVFLFDPNIGDISTAPAIYQIHAIAAWVFLALFPFTRLVHFWSAPIWYLTRPFVLYRRGTGRAELSPGESRAWRSFGRARSGPPL